MSPPGLDDEEMKDELSNVCLNDFQIDSRRPFCMLLPTVASDDGSNEGSNEKHSTAVSENATPNESNRERKLRRAMRVGGLSSWYT